MDMERAKVYSRKLWEAIQSRDVEYLTANIHEEAMFVHMGVSLNRDRELDVIKSGSIVYKEIDFQEFSVRGISSTVIVYNKMRLTAIVGGNEVTNPFVVTEVYTVEHEIMKLASLSFTKIVY